MGKKIVNKSETVVAKTTIRTFDDTPLPINGTTSKIKSKKNDVTILFTTIPPLPVGGTTTVKNTLKTLISKVEIISRGRVPFKTMLSTAFAVYDGTEIATVLQAQNGPSLFPIEEETLKTLLATLKFKVTCPKALAPRDSPRDNVKDTKRHCVPIISTAISTLTHALPLSTIPKLVQLFVDVSAKVDVTKDRNVAIFVLSVVTFKANVIVKQFNVTGTLL